MKINNDKTVTLSQYEFVVFLSSLKFFMDNISKSIANGYELSEQDKEQYDKISKIYDELKDNLIDNIL